MFIPVHNDKPVLVVELKYNKTAETALEQIKKKKYLESLRNYEGEMLLVGINYDKESKKHEKGIVPRDTNSLEGGINSHIKQLNFIHRGMRDDDEQRMIGWDLIRKSKFRINGCIKDLNIQKTQNLSPKTRLKSSQFDT